VNLEDWGCWNATLFIWLLQSLHADLNDAVKEKEELSRQMQDYVIEVKRCQELLSAKVYKSASLKWFLTSSNVKDCIFMTFYLMPAFRWRDLERDS